jgi:GLPGLI family protein
MLIKKYLLSLILSINFYCTAQVKTGSIQYGLVMSKDLIEYKNLNKIIEKEFKKGNELAEKVEYTLNFNEEEAYYFANPLLIETNTSLNYLVITGSGKLKYYQNEKTKEYREFIDSPRLGKLIVNRQIIYEWTLHNETKMIDGYTCYKATTPVMSLRNNFKSTDRKFDITAWYAPEIPIGYGPVGYGGLPGLILELQFYAQTFYAKKINLNLDKTLEIDKLMKPKAISEQTLQEMANGTLTKVQLEATQE